MGWRGDLPPPLWCYVRGFVQWSGPPHRPPHRVEGGTSLPPCGAMFGVSCSGLGPPTGPPTGWRGGPPSPLWCYVRGFVQWSGPPRRPPHRVEGGTSLPPVVLCPGFRAVVWAPPPAPPQGGGGDLPPPCGAMSGVSCSGLGPPTGPPTGWRGGPPSPPVVLCPGFRAVVW